MPAGPTAPANFGVGSWIERRARIAPDDVALIGGDRSFTYAQLAARVRRLASGLHRLGVAHGDRVAWLGPNHPAFLESLFASGLLGAVLAPVNHRLEEAEIRSILRDAEPAVLIQHGATGSIPPPPSVRHRIVVAGPLEGAFDFEALVTESPDDPIMASVGVVLNGSSCDPTALPGPTARHTVFGAPLGQEMPMPLYMDRHDLPQATAEDVAQAHIRDLEIQERYGVRYLTYWFDPASGNVFCLADAPDMEAAETVHRESHGLVAHQMIEVDGRIVTEFLGRVHEPAPGEPWVATAFRTILFTDMEGSTSLTQQHGDARALHIMRAHDRIVRGALERYGGTEVDHAGDGIMASFTSVVKAVECAIATERGVAEHNETAEIPFKVRIGITAGEPVTESDRIFGAAIQLAARICGCADGGQIFTSNVIRELCIGKGFSFLDHGPMSLKGFEEPVSIFEVAWQPA